MWQIGGAVTYEEWENSVPEVMRADAVWRMKAYRMALFLSDIALTDAKVLLRRRDAGEHGDQLLRATAKISACIVEGYSRGTGKDRAKFYEYALGSTRESRDWYYKSRHARAPAVTEHRLQLTSDLSKLLITMIATERRNNRRLDNNSS